MVFERPLLHVAHAVGNHLVDHQLRVVDGAQVVAQQGVGVPEVFQRLAVLHGLSDSRDAHLVMVAVHVTQFHAGVGCYLFGLPVGAQVGHVNGETIGAQWRDRTDARLIAIDSGELGKLRILDDAVGEFRYLGGVQRFGCRLGHAITWLGGIHPSIEPGVARGQTFR